MYQSKTLYLQKRFLLTNFQFLSLRRKPNRPKFMILFHLFIQTLSSPLLETTFLHLIIKVSIDNFSVVLELWIQKVIDFVACVGILNFRQFQKTAVKFDIFPVFQVTSLPQCWLLFFFRFSSWRIVCGWAFDLKLIALFVALKPWWSKKGQMLFFLKTYNVQTHVFFMSDFFHHGRIWRNCSLQGLLSSKFINCFPALDSCWTTTARFVCDKEFCRCSKSYFFKTSYFIISSIKVII